MLRVVGTQGCLSVGWKTLEIERPGEAGAEVLAGGYEKNAAFERVQNRFLEGIRQEDARVDDAGLRAIGFVESGYRSLRSKDWVEVA